jgi:hypothetical protein
MLPTAGTPSDLARLVIEQSALSNFDRYRGMAGAIAEQAPNRAQVAQTVRAFVEATRKDGGH